MNRLIILILTFISIQCFGQLPYSWIPSTNPGWTSNNNGSGGPLNWNGACLGGVVTTNCSGNYSNNQNTSYTSPIINASCTNASTISISFNISGNAEYGYDFLFCEYSTDGGVTWINFYGPGIGLTGNAGAFPGILWTLPSIPTNSNFMFRFRFTSDFIFRYEGYKITNFSIICNVVLPIELLSFDVYNYNTYNYITWLCATELNNDYFILERSSDGVNWVQVAIIDGSGTTNVGTFYSYKDYSFEKDSYNYYRLTQVDFNGQSKTFDIIVVNNINHSEKKIIRVVNMMGEEVDPDTTNEILVYYYSDGTYQKVCKIKN
mgnify:CR=1 FL=1